MNEDYQVQVFENSLDTDWDRFVESTPGGHHVQTSRWGQVKVVLGWRAIRVIVTSHGLIMAGAQLLIRPIPAFGAIGYVTKGPLTATQDENLTELMIHQISEIGKKHRVQLLAIQPPNNGGPITEQLIRLGYLHSSLELAPAASILMDLNPDLDVILSGMKRQTRQNIRRSEREGILTRAGTDQDLHTFYQLHLATSQRQGFAPYSERYFQCMWEVFAPQGNIQIILAEYKGLPVSALLIIPFGDTVIAKVFGWSGLHPDLRPNDAVFWGSIQWAKCNGFRNFDFEGIDLRGAQAVLRGEPLTDALKHTPDFFKLGFGGQIVLYPEAYEIVSNPIFRWAYRKASPEVGGHSVPSRILDHLRKL